MKSLHKTPVSGSPYVRRYTFTVKQQRKFWPMLFGVTNQNLHLRVFLTSIINSYVWAYKISFTNYQNGFSSNVFCFVGVRFCYTRVAIRPGFFRIRPGRVLFVVRVLIKITFAARYARLQWNSWCRIQVASLSKARCLSLFAAIDWLLL